MKTWDSPLQSVRSAAFLAGAAAVLLSSNSVLNDFAFDDLSVIVENTAIQDLGTLPEALISPYWPNEYGRLLGLWRPVATALYGKNHDGSHKLLWYNDIHMISLWLSPFHTHF